MVIVCDNGVWDPEPTYNLPHKNLNVLDHYLSQGFGLYPFIKVIYYHNERSFCLGVRGNGPTMSIPHFAKGNGPYSLVKWPTSSTLHE